MCRWAPFTVFPQPYAIKWWNYFLFVSNLNKCVSSNSAACQVHWLLRFNYSISHRLPCGAGQVTACLYQTLVQLHPVYASHPISYRSFSYIVEPSTPWSLSWFFLLVPRAVFFFFVAISRGGKLKRMLAVQHCHWREVSHDNVIFIQWHDVDHLYIFPLRLKPSRKRRDIV